MFWTITNRNNNKAVESRLKTNETIMKEKEKETTRQDRRAKLFLVGCRGELKGLNDQQKDKLVEIIELETYEERYWALFKYMARGEFIVHYRYRDNNAEIYGHLIQ